MNARQSMKKLVYFTIEDESMLAEAFAKFEEETLAVTYKVAGTEDVFVTTWDTQQIMERHDLPYNQLAEEDPNHVAIYHSELSREELADHEDSLRALALAYRAIAMVCVGVNGEADLGFDLSDGAKQYTYFTAPAGHTFIWRWFNDRDGAADFVEKFTAGDKQGKDWADNIYLDSSSQLASFH
jgi:hypothetical protein